MMAATDREFHKRAAEVIDDTLFHQLPEDQRAPTIVKWASLGDRMGAEALGTSVRSTFLYLEMLGRILSDSEEDVEMAIHALIHVVETQLGLLDGNREAERRAWSERLGVDID